MSHHAAQTLNHSPSQSTSVADVMTPGIITCPADMPLDRVAALMASARVHAIAVCRVGDAEQDPRGAWAFVTDTDLLAALVVAGFERLTAGAIAGTELLTVDADDMLSAATARLVGHQVSHAVVLRDGVPAGVLSSLDVARSVGQQAG